MQKAQDSNRAGTFRKSRLMIRERERSTIKFQQLRADQIPEAS